MICQACGALDHYETSTNCPRQRMPSINPPPFLDTRTRYLNDHVFSRLVDTLYVELRKGTWTPTELREAVMFAAVKYENETIAYIAIGADGWPVRIRRG